MIGRIRMRLLGAGVAIAFGLALPAPAGAQVSPVAPASFTRGAYGKDGSTTGYRMMAASGFNTVMTGPYPEQLATVDSAGMKGVIWLGNFINAPTCAFEKDDATITRLVDGIGGSRVIPAYYLGDEPHVTECPHAPALFRQRTMLVHALDPGSLTFTVIQASE